MAASLAVGGIAAQRLGGSLWRISTIRVVLVGNTGHLEGERGLVPNSRLARVVVALRPARDHRLADSSHLFQLHIQLVVRQVLVQDLLAESLRARKALL